jgi:hypothetical protein
MCRSSQHVRLSHFESSVMRGMMQTNPVSHSGFTSPEVYVLVNANAVAEPRPFHWLATDPFHWLATDQVDDKSAVHCFLSFSDCMLAGLRIRAGCSSARMECLRPLACRFASLSTARHPASRSMSHARAERKSVQRVYFLPKAIATRLRASAHARAHHQAAFNNPCGSITNFFGAPPSNCR